MKYLHTTLLLAQANNGPAEIVGWSQWGVLGALGAIITGGLAAFRYLMDRNKEALAALAASHEKAYASLAEEVKEGFRSIADVMEKRDMSQQMLFDKHLDVTVKVTESISRLSSEVSANSREIADLKSAVRQVQAHQTGRALS